ARCGQKLRASDDKAGRHVPCPRCGTEVTVTSPPISPVPPPAPTYESSDPPQAPFATPPPPSTRAGPSPTGSTGTPPIELPHIIVHDDEVEWVYESAAEGKTSASHGDSRRLTIPRHVIYTQGILLAAVGILCFVIGFVARGTDNGSAPPVAVPVASTLSGRVTYQASETPVPAVGSVVIALPADSRPPLDSKLAREGLRPGDPVPGPDHPSLRTIHSLGGDAGRCDEQGRYRLRLSRQGEIHILVIGTHVPPGELDPPDRKDIAQLGRYFVSPVDLLDRRPYQWTTISVRGDQEWDVRF
ncbi:MAG: hypothetical protein AB7O38_04820, partial [Pirellulaceae bacterium]